MRDVDIDAYFKRIAFASAPAADLATLNALHRLHPMAIPFENLSSLLSEPIPLDSAALVQKLVSRRRGGYCFEQNRLFADVLQALGFEVTTLAARVVWGRGGAPPGPRTHMVLKVRIGADEYLSDVGFGGLTLTGPLPLIPDVEHRTPHEVFRLIRHGIELELEASVRGEWRPMYRFDLQEQLPIDFEVLNHFVATHPSSHFRTTLMAARRSVDGGYKLRNSDLAIYEGMSRNERKLASAREVADALESVFGIELPRSAALDALLESIAT